MKHLCSLLLCGALLICGPVFGAEPTPTPASSAQEPGNDTGYWLSASGKRHNEKCRYYKKSKGAPCGAKDGVACKVCGG